MLKPQSPNRFFYLMDVIRDEASSLGIKVKFPKGIPNRIPCYSSVEEKKIVIPQHFLYETTESAIMLSHEMAHITLHDDLSNYNTDDGLRIYERCANVGSLYFVVGNYMSIYDVHEANYNTANQFTRRFHIEKYGLLDHVKRISQEHVDGIPIPVDKINVLYRLMVKHKITRKEYDYLKARVVMHI